MRIFLIAAFVLFIFALVVAAGQPFIAVWNVWLCAGLASLVLDKLAGDRGRV